MQSVALVGMNGLIDFLCYPGFDFAYSIRRAAR